ncbi:YbhB/YbcL family Raf kinase inhibitor-like protein [Massilia horti]|nr:YbhB/YbcL family Raf kinase inhibitor-like protein [Massilia horti]
MKRLFNALLLCLAASGVLAQAPSAVSIDAPQTKPKGKMKLAVHSASFTTESILNPRYTGYGDNLSPALSWSPVPGARSYAIIVEDPDARAASPRVHWLMWNIPAQVTSLPEGVPRQARLRNPPGALQGKNSRGSIGYAGPQPPVGSPPHHYHFQVFALNALLILPGGSDREQLLDAMKGHVLAKGYLIGQFAQR